ncbi:hypothetical protein [Tenacibaculum finnmarkense]|uniref:hypothetical protein n=1 Tax=Tenacibaculum finnmarkense TaxID=2781243 RepID=UPI001EFBADCA|nr:hypothetical protein [Tenacibaculum finnmarkense]
MESKLNIHGLAGTPRGGLFMDGNGVEKRRPTRPTIDRGGHKPMRPMLVRPGRPKGGKYVPDDKPMPVTVKTLNPKPNERGGHKPIRPTVRPVRPPNSTKPVFVVTRPNIDDVEGGKIKYNQDVKAFVLVTNKAEQTAIKLAFDKKIKAEALANQKAAALARQKAAALAKQKAAALAKQKAAALAKQKAAALARQKAAALARQKAAALAKQKAEKKASDNVLNESNITKESNSISFLHTEKTKVFFGLVLLAGAIIYSSKNSKKSVKRTVKKTVKKSN